MRAANGAPRLDLTAGAGDCLVELTVAVLGFAAGDPASTLTGALERWRPHAPSAAEARADLAAVRATLEDRLTGPTPRLHALIDALTTAEAARRTTGAAGVDPLDAFVPPRTPLRPSRSTRIRRAASLRRITPHRHRPVRRPGRATGGPRTAAGRPPRHRRPKRVLPLGPVVAAVLVVLTGAFAAHPGLPEALLPNFSGPHAPRPAPSGSARSASAPSASSPVAPAPSSQVAGAPRPGAPARAGTGRPQASPDAVVMAAAVVPSTPSPSPAGPSASSLLPVPTTTPAPPVAAPALSPKAAKHAAKSAVRNLGTDAKGAKHGATAAVGNTSGGAVAGAGGQLHGKAVRRPGGGSGQGGGTHGGSA
ncbi:MAG TPA: hypothetical protein VFW24_14605 [Acidimicrobiales bacterium]|nr:hypothetical protein [Acidimicrobiales bacterium]